MTPKQRRRGMEVQLGQVDKFSPQHVRYPDMFGLGDASNLPTSKTGAAIRKQAPVVVENLLALRAGQPLTTRYDGYTSCPVVTGRGKLIMAEFNYAKEPVEGHSRAWWAWAAVS